jgi:multicomponent Na+:H+ antiporter subunit F
MFSAAAAALLVTMGLALIRALKGPTVYDRILAVNMFGTKTVLIIAVMGFLAGRPEFLDIALVYALINFVTTIAVLKVFKFGDLGGTHDLKEDSRP